MRFKSAWSCSADLRHAITDRIKLERPEKIYWSHKTELFSVSIYWLLFAERLKSGSGRRVQTEEVVNPPCFFLNQIKCVGVGWLSQCYKFSDLVGGVLHSIQALGWGGWGWGGWVWGGGWWGGAPKISLSHKKQPKTKSKTEGNSFNLAWRVTARVHLCCEFPRRQNEITPRDKVAHVERLTHNGTLL